MVASVVSAFCDALRLRSGFL
ncbi:hypothetical protein E2C01_074588 [Portunus trituberculatus]|uniref:Uncharacterized protein n=1 Tax=Portunus trituberculatus TaxID=210409 RepID=A0A5B7ICV2_PORTR|nr:hypothetical protein [Portunus trituberculatus]